MNLITIIWIVLGTLIGLAILLCGIFILIKYILLKKYSNYYDSLEVFLSHEPYIDTLTALRTVDITLKQQEKKYISRITSASNNQMNDDHEKLAEINNYKEKFASQFIQIEERIKNMKKLSEMIFDNLDKSIIFSCNKLINKVEEEKKHINEIKKEITKDTKKFIDPIRDFEKEKYRFQKIIREFEKKIQEWDEEIQSDEFKKNLEQKISLIQEYLGEALNHIGDAENELAYRSFTMFKKTLYDLIAFGNYYDLFKIALFVRATKSFEKVYKYIEKVETTLGTNLNNLNVQTLLKNVNDELTNAKESFYKLNVSETEENIEKYFKSILHLTYTISLEINAFNFFIRYGIKEIRNCFIVVEKKYFELKSSCENILQIDKMIYQNLENELKEIESIINEIKIAIDNFTEIENSDTSYFEKQNKYKKIFVLMNHFFENCSHLEKTIDAFYTDGISQSLRYNKLKMIFINGLAEIKKFNIQLNIEDKYNISEIESKKQEIENYLINNQTYVEEELKEKVNVFFELMVKFVCLTIKKTFILKSFLLINNEYSYRRINDKFFDKKIIESEAMLEMGQYDKGIINLINAIRGIKN